MQWIRCLWESFLSRALYAEAFHLWKGIGFFLLFFLTVLHSLVVSVKFHGGIHRAVYDIAPGIVRQVPPVTFSDGRASTPEARAYEIKEPTSGLLIAIIDTRVPHPPDDLGKAHVFVAERSTTFKKSEMERRTYEYASLGNRVIDQPLINSWLALTAKWGATASAPFIFAGLLFYRFAQLLFFSLIALAAGSAMGLSGSYAATLRVTAAALTPPLLLALFLSALEKDFSGSSIVFFLIATGYVLFGVKSASDFRPAPPAVPVSP